MAEVEVALEPGDEITVEWSSPYSGKINKCRVVFRSVREEDGSLEVWDPKKGHIRNFAPESIVTRHRKRKLGRKRT